MPSICVYAEALCNRIVYTHYYEEYKTLALFRGHADTAPKPVHAKKCGACIFPPARFRIPNRHPPTLTCIYICGILQL